jgi:hypothetical protein
MYSQGLSGSRRERNECDWIEAYPRALHAQGELDNCDSSDSKAASDKRRHHCRSEGSYHSPCGRPRDLGDCITSSRLEEGDVCPFQSVKASGWQFRETVLSNRLIRQRNEDSDQESGLNLIGASSALTMGVHAQRYYFQHTEMLRAKGPSDVA